MAFLKLHWLAQGGHCSIHSFLQASHTICETVSLTEFLLNLGKWCTPVQHLSIFRSRQIGPKGVLCLPFDYPHINNLSVEYISKDCSDRELNMHNTFILPSLCVLLPTSIYQIEFMLPNERKSSQTTQTNQSYCSCIVMVLCKHTTYCHFLSPSSFLKLCK